MAFRHTQLLAQLFNTVQCHIVLADGRYRLGHQRRQGAGCLVRLAHGAEQRIGHRRGAGAVQLGNQFRCTGAGGTVCPAGCAQLQQIAFCAVAHHPHRQQMAVTLGHQRQGGCPQQNITALPRAVKPLQQADAAGKHPHPKPVSGQGQRLCAIQLGRLGGRAVDFRIKYQFRHLYINKMLFSSRL